MAPRAAIDSDLGFQLGDHMPSGQFSKDTFISTMKTMVQEAFAEGYDRFRAAGDESFIVRNGVDIKEWFAAESALNEIVPDYPHFFFCLYYIPADQLPG